MHPKSQKFHAYLKKLGELHDRKQGDYGTPTDPFANITASRDFGIRPCVGAIIRLNDKVNRLKAWCQNGTLANEGVEDSLLDIAVYALIALIELEGEDAALTAEALRLNDEKLQLSIRRRPLYQTDAQPG